MLWESLGEDRQLTSSSHSLSLGLAGGRPTSMYPKPLSDRCVLADSMSELLYAHEYMDRVSARRRKERGGGVEWSAEECRSKKEGG